MVHIIGGGIVGCSIAWRLAQRGARIVISEAGRVGRQASWAGAGILSPGGDADSDPLWARRTLESLALYPAFIRELAAESGVPIDYRQCGALELAYTNYDLVGITRKAERQAALGIRSSLLSPVETRSLVPGLAINGMLGARHYPDEVVVDPRAIMQALEAVLRARGVEIRENTTVSSIAESDDPVVLAAGAWSSSILSGIPAAFPVKGYLIGYELPPGSVSPILRHGHTYVLQRSNGSTIAGSTTDRVGFDATIDPAMVHRLHERAHRYLPHLLLASPDSSWIGFRPGIEGDVPQVGRVEGTNIWLAYGHYKKGILLAPLTAELIAREIASS